MPIRRVDNFIDAYREHAAAADLHALSGRGAQRQLTAYVNRQICDRMRFGPHDVVVDVGCGDGSLLASIAGAIRQGIGIAPTNEEVERLRQAHSSHRNLRFETGLAESLPLTDGTATKTVCNGVLMLLRDRPAVRQALGELKRISARGAQVFIGEVPDRDEAATAREAYGDSLLRWLLFSFREGGVIAGLRVAKTIAGGVLSHEPLVVQPKHCTFLRPDEMSGLLAELPWTLLWRGPYQPPITGATGASRWHYLLELP